MHRLPAETDDTSGYIGTILADLREHGWFVESRNLTLESEGASKGPIHPALRSMLVERLIPGIDADFILLVDDFFELETGWFSKAVDLLTTGQADLVVASRNSRDWFGKIAAMGVERLTGCQSVNAPALVLRRTAIQERHPSIKPAGQWIALEFQLRIPSDKRIVLQSQFVQRAKPGTPRFGKSELSFLKSYVDHKFGSLSRLVQFCSVGFSGMVIDLTAYAGLQSIFRRTSLTDITIPFVKSTADLAIAGFLAIWLAITWNFILNRRLTFNDSRRNSSIFRQYGTYVLSNAVALVVSFMVRLWLPANFRFFDDHKLVAAIVGIVMATGISFNMTRYFVFSTKKST